MIAPCRKETKLATLTWVLGHDVGDRLLNIVVPRLLQHVPKHCVVARLSEDEFII